jgi:hypothetical protein
MRARNADVLKAVAASVSHLSSVRIVDLACGTGSTLRAISRHLPQRQHWQLADNDTELLAQATAMTLSPDVTVTALPFDLNRNLEVALGGGVDLVATSALLDLVSESWLECLAAEIAARSIPLYAALTYDGRIELTPADALDEAIIAAFNAHQRTDKGFGPALGPAAPSSAIRRFEALNYSVGHGTSDWYFGSGDRHIQDEILTGWASAARTIGVLSLADTDAWLTRRQAAVAAGESTIRVGHVDIFAAPIGTR